jgi:sugar lactone lactonase YvrE
MKTKSSFLFSLVIGLFVCFSLQAQFYTLDKVIGTLNGPSDITGDAEGNIYVSELFNHRIQKLDSEGNPLSMWGQMGGSNGELMVPAKLAIDHLGNIYVTEQPNFRVQKFTNDGIFLKKIGVEQESSPSTSPGQWGQPYGMAFDSEHNFYVADLSNSRVQKFSSDGTYLEKFASNSPNAGNFIGPAAIAIDKNNNVYIAEAGNNQIKKFDVQGNFITEWGGTGTEDGKFRYPIALCIDANSNVLVVDQVNGRIQIFDSSGTYITKIGSEGTADNQFKNPSGIYVGSSGFIYVADQGNNAIKKYKTIQVVQSEPIILFPNPSSDGHFFLSTEGTIKTVSVVNAFGQKESFSTNSIHTSLRGLLMIEVITDKGSGTKKIQIQ